MARARQALTGFPAQTVLFGLSMGASVAAGLLAERPQTPALLLWHNTGGGGDETVRPGLRLQLHIADPDVYESATQVADWEQHLMDAGAEVRVFSYPGSGHLFTDPGTPDYDGPAADLTWQRSLSFLSGL